MMRSKIIAAYYSLVFSFFYLAVTAQKTSGITVGQPFPMEQFNDVLFYSKGVLNLKEFKGKWVILDFWDKDCSACIAQFPKLRDEQKEFESSVQFISIASRDFNGQNKAIFSTFYKKLNLNFPGVFVDSLVIYKELNVGMLPFTVIIDPHGQTFGLTDKLSKEKLGAIIGGESPSLSAPSYGTAVEQITPYKWDATKPLFTDDNGGPDTSFIFRSLLARWTPQMPHSSMGGFVHSAREERIMHNKGRYEAYMMGVVYLYRVAYLGKYYNGMLEKDTAINGKYWFTPVFKIKDTSILNTNYVTGKNVYCYSLTVPADKANEKFMMGVMQNDLKTYFGYSVNIIEREMPVWVLSLTHDSFKEKLVSKDSGPVIEFDNGTKWQGGTYKNLMMKDLVALIKLYYGEDSVIPLLDETRITGKINITLNMFKGDLASVQKTLSDNGFVLKKRLQLIKVIEVSDPINH